MYNNNNTYYCCKCVFFQDELILCDECNKWVNDVELTIEKHLNEFKPVFHAKRLKNKKNKNQKTVMCISIFIIG